VLQRICGRQPLLIHARRFGARGSNPISAHQAGETVAYECSPGSSAGHRGLMLRRLSTQEIEASARASAEALARVAQTETAERQALANGFRLCAACGVRLVAAEICSHHTMVREDHRLDGWAMGNRIWCEFVHGKWRARQGVLTAPAAQDPLAGGSA
jgi:hypothetical protein